MLVSFTDIFRICEGKAECMYTHTHAHKEYLWKVIQETGKSCCLKQGHKELG